MRNPISILCGKKETPKKSKYADITVVFDKSGSMESMRDEMIKAFNEQVEEMRKTPGDNRWTMIQFDDPSSAKGAGEEFPHVVFSDKSEKEIPTLTDKDFVPRGWTALVDALCKTIKQTEIRTSGTDNKVVMMVVTDGRENSSREYTSEKLLEMVARTQKNGWEYIYLGANQDSFATAKGYGMTGDLNKYQGFGGSGTIQSGTIGVFNNYNWEQQTGGLMCAMGSGFVGLRHVASGGVLC